MSQRAKDDDDIIGQGGFSDTDFIHNNRQRDEHLALNEIRRESLDPFNRLHSISEDAEFVNLIHESYRTLPLLPNLRCGAWYADPTVSSSEPAYFKSTDGHFSNWNFNLRRPNLHLLPLIIAHHGMIFVDSTRAGKRIPDALSKTVPIWCAVINRAQTQRFTTPGDWDDALYTPPHSVSRQEHAQIEQRLDAWCNMLLNSSYEIPKLIRPLRPFWITPSTTTFPQIDTSISSFYPIICVSASKLVPDGVERRQAGFAYVQGSGDDHELWSAGLAPDVFWRHKEDLLRVPRTRLMDFISGLTSQAKPVAADDHWSSPPTPIKRVGGLLSISAIADLPAAIFTTSHLSQGDDKASLSPCLILRHGNAAESTLKSSSPHIMMVEIAKGKKGEIQLVRDVLPRSLDFIRQHLLSGSNVHVACTTGKDLGVGIVVAALQSFFDEYGKLLPVNKMGNSLADKASLRTRLQWIIASRPNANPARSTLKRVNEYFLSSPTFRRI